MSRRRRIALLAVVAAQLALVIALAGFAALDLAFGREVRLRVQPLDPLDVFRGNYVVLRYDISNLTVPFEVAEGERVCAHLAEAGGSWRLQFVSPSADGDGTAICGRARSAAGAGQSVGVEYGIETYYASSDRAQELEREIGSGDVFAVVDLDDDGSARIERLDVEG